MNMETMVLMNSEFRNHIPTLLGNLAIICAAAWLVEIGRLSVAASVVAGGPRFWLSMGRFYSAFGLDENSALSALIQQKPI